MRYTVTVKEIYDSYVEIEAESPEEALKKVRGGEGDEVDQEYYSTMDSSTWDVSEPHQEQTS